MTDDVQRLDAPNQQVVRPDGSHPADEGTGAGKPRKGTGAGKDAGKDAGSKAPAAASGKAKASEGEPSGGERNG